MREDQPNTLDLPANASSPTFYQQYNTHLQSWYKGIQIIMWSRFWLLNYFVKGFNTSTIGRAMGHINTPGNWLTTCIKLKQGLFTCPTPKPDLCKVQEHTLIGRGLLSGPWLHQHALFALVSRLVHSVPWQHVWLLHKFISGHAYTNVTGAETELVWTALSENCWRQHISTQVSCLKC